MANLSLGRVSVVEEVSDLLRQRIARSEIKVGQRLREADLAEEFGVSRNTLREAFRILLHEDLLVREKHRGVIVRVLQAHDVQEIYQSRRVIECAAIREIERLPNPDLGGVREAVESGEAGSRSGIWIGVGSADIDFHRELVAVAGSRHLNRLMGGMAAELRLAFGTIQDLEGFHAPFLKLNRQIYELLLRGEIEAAEQLMTSYLQMAEDRLLESLDVEVA